MTDHTVNRSSLCVAVLCLIPPLAACNSRDPPSGGFTPSVLPQPPTVTPTLSGQVFEVSSGSRVPVAGIEVFVSVRQPGPWVWEGTTTGPGGRYHFQQLPAGWAGVFAYSATHRQVCGATAVLGAATQLDVEITSRANSQPSPTMPPLRVTGQIYEITPAGRIGIDGAEIHMDWMVPDSPFLSVYADKDGSYTACGIPANTRIAFDTFKPGYQGHYVWHQFSADTTLDVELKRQ